VDSFFYLDDVCVTVSGPSPTPTCPPLINEGFDNINNLPGWVMLNHSQPLGITNWFQGDNFEFPAFDGLPTAYIAADFDNGGGVATISNWLLIPQVSLQNGSTLTFYTRTLTGSGFPDRLQVRMSTNGASINVGTTATQVGDFTNLLLDINPTYVMHGYPEVWTQYTVTISGVAPGTSGRLAFRYFVENGGPSGANSNYIGIDRAVYTVPCGAPSPTPTASPTPTPTATFTPTLTPTATATATATFTPTPSATATHTPSPTPTATFTPTATATATATFTPTPTATATHTPSPTPTATFTPTATATATATTTATATATATPTATPTIPLRGTATPRPRPIPPPRS